MNKPRRMTIRDAMIPFAVAMFLLVALPPASLHGQGFYGSVVGTVTDATGAVVPGATVTVTDIGTSKAVKVQSDANGKYSVFNLVPAEYKVEVEKASFKRSVHDDVPVQVGETARVDLSLAVGNVSETVEVSTRTALLPTDSSSLSQVVEGAQVQEMPLNGRNVMNLLSLTPGVIANGGASGGTGIDQQGKRTAGGLGWGDYQIGGAIPGQSAQFIDGAANNLLGNNIVALVPTQDAVQEFSVISSAATADFGRYGGGVVNMTTKSGANAFHGTAYEYLRNRDFNANDWFSNQNGVARPPWTQNQYGAEVSGPIKRDKAFFMANWEGFQESIGLITTTNVPTAAMQNGVFLGKTIVDPLYNAGTGAGCNVQPIPAGGVTVGGTTYTGTGTYIANLYQGSCGDPLNRVLKTYYPLPNSQSAGGNFFSSTPIGNTQNQYNGRVDYSVSEKQRIFARYSYWNVKDTRDSVFGDKGLGGVTWPTADVAQDIFTHQAVLGDTYTLNPSTILDVRVDWTRVTNPDNPENTNVNMAQFDQFNANKIYTALAPQMSVKTLPGYQLGGNNGGGDNLFQMNNFTNYSETWYNNYHLAVNLVKILGAHTFKLGVDDRLMDSSGTGFEGAGAGAYTYIAGLTSNPSIANSGDEFATFLMGYASSAQFQTYNKVAGYMYYQAYFATDTWQATRKLTLNLGLRYEIPGSIAERHNRATVLLPNAVDPVTGVTGTEALVASSLYSPRGILQSKYDGFAPRVGFAYRATGSTVVHGGYGLSYLPNDLSGVFGLGIMPFFSTVNSNYTQQNAQTAVPLQSMLANILSSGGIIAAPGRSNPSFMTQFASKTKYLGQNISAPDPYQPYPYTQQWNFAISHEFKNDLMMEVGYAGLHGTNLPGLGNFLGNFSIDELQSKYYSLGPTVLESMTGSATATAAGYATCPNAPGFAAGTISVGQCLRPNPYYNNVDDSDKFAGTQNYGSVQVKAEKRFKSAGIIMANYVWSRNMSNSDTELGNLEGGSGHNVTTNPQDFNNLAGEYSLLAFDVKNRGVVSYLLNLPFGKGQKVGENLTGLANGFASGWSINGITTFQSGFPIFVVDGNGNDVTNNWGGGQLRPNVVAGCNKKIAGGGQSRVLAGSWFNFNCFVHPTSSSDPLGKITFGNEPRVDPDLRADGIKNFDMSFQKSTPIFEKSSFVFRVEFFNVFNRVQFAAPINSLGAGFGEPNNQANRPRQIQLSGRVNF